MVNIVLQHSRRISRLALRWQASSKSSFCSIASSVILVGVDRSHNLSASRFCAIICQHRAHERGECEIPFAIERSPPSCARYYQLTESRRNCMHRLLVINPGSTSTKVAVYEDEQPLFVETLRHSSQEIGAFSHILDQYEFRLRGGPGPAGRQQVCRLRPCRRSWAGVGCCVPSPVAPTRSTTRWWPNCAAGTRSENTPPTWARCWPMRLPRGLGCRPLSSIRCVWTSSTTWPGSRACPRSSARACLMR